MKRRGFIRLLGAVPVGVVAAEAALSKSAPTEPAAPVVESTDLYDNPVTGTGHKLAPDTLRQWADHGIISQQAYMDVEYAGLRYRVPYYIN